MPLPFQLNTTGGSRIDPDASAYIAELTSAGASVTGGQRLALDTFIRAEKAAERWDLHRRLYFPIWGIAAANAICMKSLTSGTFNGTVTHGAGFVVGDGTTGYFAPPAGSEYGNLGLSNSSASIFYLALNETAKTEALNGLAGSSNERFGMGVPATLSTMFLHADSGTPATLTSGQRSGIFVGSSTATNARTVLRTTTAGLTRQSVTTLSTAAPPNIVPFFLARNNNGSPALYVDSQLGLYGYGPGLTSSQDGPFSLSLKNLWESCTGLTLP